MKNSQREGVSIRAKAPAVALVTLAIAALAPLQAFANTLVPVANGTFDTVAPLASGQCILAKGCTGTVGAKPGWTFNGPNVGILNPSTTMYPSWSGGYVGIVGGELDGPDWMDQNVGTMPANVTYTLSFDVGCRLDRPCAGYAVSAYGDLFYSDLLKSVSAGAATQTPGAFQHVTMTFDSMAGNPLLIKISITKKGAKSESNFDNVQLTYVPK